jgi:hypothetical protein
LEKNNFPICMLQLCFYDDPSTTSCVSMMTPPRQVHKYLSYWCVSHNIVYRDKTRMRRIDKKSLKIPMGLSEDTTNELVRRYHQWACQKIPPMGLSEDTTNGRVRSR